MSPGGSPWNPPRLLPESTNSHADYMILGILGGIGSGKSTVTRLLVEEGASALDADRIAHEVLDSPPVREEVRAWLGEAVVDPGGGVDRQAVARRVFDDPEALERLEKLVHPEVRRRIEREVERFRARPDAERSLLVLDVPLLAETPLRALCDRLLFVEAPPEVRRARTRNRGWDDAEHARRESRQAPPEDKRNIADYIIENRGSLAALEARVRELYRRLVGSRTADGPTQGDAAPSAAETNGNDSGRR